MFRGELFPSRIRRVRAIEACNLLVAIGLASTSIMSPSMGASAARLAEPGSGITLEMGEEFSSGVPVEVVYRRQLESGHARDVIGIVHAVRRVPGATIVYASQGYSGYEKASHYGKLWGHDFFGEDNNFTYAALVDPKNKRYWFPYRVAGESACLCPTDLADPIYRVGVNDGEEDGGKAGDGFWIFAIAYPPLPEDVEFVDLSITGDGKFVTDIPVGEGALTPMAEPSEEVKQESFQYFQKVGSAGWPYIPEEDYFRDKTVNDQKLNSSSRDSEIPLFGSVNEYVDSVKRGVGKKSDGLTAEYPMSADVAFDFDSASLTSGAVEALDQVVEDAEGAVTSVSVFGYTDSQGESGYNDELSHDRAAAVADYLKHKLESANYVVKGFGEEDPVASNGTEEGRALNRRVVVTVSR